MKKIVLIFTALCLIVCGSLAFVGCDKDEESDGDNQPTHPPQIAGDDVQNNENDNNGENADNSDLTEKEKLVAEYEAFIAMNTEQQTAFAESFSSLAAFNEWRIKAYQAYEESRHRDIIDGGGETGDIGKLDNE